MEQSLTKREFEVLELLTEGKNNIEIAHSLKIKHGTVKAHISSILYKFHAKNRVDAAVFAVTQKIV